MNKLKIGLALGGGGARGFAHLGVLEVLQKEKISIDIISGTSMGALVGGLYSKYKDIEIVKKKIYSSVEKDVVKKLEANFSSLEKKAHQESSQFHKPLLFIKEFLFWNMRLFKKHLVDYQPFEDLLKGLYGEAKFSDCQIPFLCVATDLVSQESVYIQDGPLWKAVFSSIALPGIFPWVRKKDKILVDGGVLESVPTLSLKDKKVNFIIGVSLEKELSVHNFRNSMEVAAIVSETRHKRLVELSLSQADLVLEPAVSGFGWADFSKIDKIIERGKEEAEKRLPLLKKKIKYKRFFPFFSALAK